jgi:GNAT superfamily N-acetyltransferase
MRSRGCSQGCRGKLVGGLSSYAAWGWLNSQWLWIDEACRGHGIADNLLSRAEAQAERRGCLAAHIDAIALTAKEAEFLVTRGVSRFKRRTTIVFEMWSRYLIRTSALQRRSRRFYFRFLFMTPERQIGNVTPDYADEK